MKIPSEPEVRQRITDMDNTVHELRRVPSSLDVEQLRVGFMLSLIFGTRRVEVFGRHGPTGADAHHVDYDDEPGFLMIRRNAKRRTPEGYNLIGPAVPLDPEYEPWAEPVLEYMQQHKDEEPFRLAKNPEYSMSIASTVASHIFQGYEWPKEKYWRVDYHPAKPSQIKDTRQINGAINYLVERDDGTRTWRLGNAMVPTLTHIPGHRVAFNLHCLRSVRRLHCDMEFDFEPKDSKAFFGWEQKGAQTHFAESERRYMHTDIRDPRMKQILYKASAKFFPKLLKPYNADGF